MNDKYEGLLADKIIVLTGALGLLGQSFCNAIADAGGTVVMADIDSQKGEGLVGKFKSKYRREDTAEFYYVDITDTESVRKLIAAVADKYGRIDAVVNNAYPRNKNYGRKFEDVTYNDFCENINMHLGGYFLVAQQFSRFFREQGEGNIVNIASIYGTVAPCFEIYSGTEMTMPVEYAAIKSAIINLTKYLAKYLKGTNIRINSISPGGILDNQPDSFLEKYGEKCLSKGMLDKEDLKGTLVYLLSGMSRYLNGQDIIVDDGFSI
jgi:NAD(P)-dependent dehydrogenase (short-subunit alcohol dehydrogenase family)